MLTGALPGRTSVRTTTRRALTLVLVAGGVFALGLGVGIRLNAPDAPAPGARAYMEGLHHLDGQAVWDARSPAAQDEDARNLFYREHPPSVAMSEHDREAYREKARQDQIRFFDQVRAKGGRIDHLRYHGGHSNGTAGIYVYETINHQTDGDLDYVWAVLTDRQGKVVEAR
jgi:hypothetical protein